MSKYASYIVKSHNFSNLKITRNRYKMTFKATNC